MGFFSKLWKGVKKTFKKIGKGIKKAFKSFGKFMGKVGILGSIALSILTGGLGIGSFFTKFAGSLGKLATTVSGPLGGILKGAAWTVGKAAQFGNTIRNGFSTLTKGVTEFFGQAGKFIGSKLGIPGAPANMTLEQAWGGYTDALSKEFSKFTGSASELFSTTQPYDTTKTLFSGSEVSPEAVKSETNVTTETTDVPQSTDVATTTDVPQATDVAAADDRSFFKKTFDRGVEGVRDAPGRFVEEAPGAVLKQYAVNLAFQEDIPDYYQVNRAAPFSSGDQAGAFQMAMTPLSQDGFPEQIAQFDYSSAIQGGAFGANPLYGQRLQNFSTTAPIQTQSPVIG